MKEEINRIKIHYDVSGQGPCLVLIHGFSDNLSMWHNQVPEFSKYFRVIRYDVRGHGKTEAPEQNYSMDLFAEDLLGLLDQLGIQKASVLGYSMGGRIALTFALKYPERTAGIIFANSGVMPPDFKPAPEQMMEMAERRKQMADLIETGNKEAIADFMAERSLSPGFRDKSPEVFRQYKEVKLQNNPAPYKSIMAAMADSMANPPDLVRIHCPVLIIAGENDGFMALDTAYYMEKAIDRASLVVFPTGHASAIEAPADFNRAVLEFLGKYSERERER